MKIEQQIIDALYRKLKGFTLEEDLRTEDGSLILVGRIRKKQIRRAVLNGNVSPMLDLLIADPARLGNLGTKRIRDGLCSLSKSQQESGKKLAECISALMRPDAKNE